MKGFAITIDAMLALSLAATMFLLIVSALPLTIVNNLDKKQLYNAGNDILTIMDSTGKLSSYIGQPTQTVNENLGYYVNLLPQNFCGNLTLKVFDGDPGPPISFSLDTTYNNITQKCNLKTESIIAKRMFVNYEEQKFGLAEFAVWLR